MQVTVVDFAKDRIVYNMAGCTREKLDNKMNLFFTTQGYKVKKASSDSTTYEIGNRVLSLLLGAFIKYHKQTITIKNEGSLFSVMLHRDSSGISGGIIGMNQVKKKITRIGDTFREYFK